MLSPDLKGDGPGKEAHTREDVCGAWCRGWGVKEGRPRGKGGGRGALNRREMSLAAFFFPSPPSHQERRGLVALPLDLSAEGSQE